MAPRARTEYEIGIKDDTSRALAKIDAGFTKLNASAVALGALGAGAAAGAFLTSRTLDAVNLADQLNKASQRTGVAVEALSQYQYAAELSDVSNETLNTSLAKLARNMDAAAQGSQEQAAAFDAINVSVKNADGTLRATQDVFDDIAVAMGKLPDGATKTALAMALFGRSGAELIPLLNAGADGFRAIREEADAFGVTISGNLARNAEQLNDDLTRLEKLSSSVGIAIAADLVPALNDVVAAFREGYEQGGLFDATLKGLQESYSKLFPDFLETRAESIQDSIADLQAEIDRLQGKGALGAANKWFNDILGKDDVVAGRILKAQLQIVALKDELEALQETRNSTGGGATSNAGADSDEERRREEARLRAALEGEEAAKKRAQEEDRLVAAQAKYVDGLRQQFITLDDSSQKAKVLADITFGSARDYSEQTKQQALALAEQLDLKKAAAEADKAALELQEQMLDALEQEAEAEAKANEAIVQRRQALIAELQTPFEKYTASVRELHDLGFQGEQLQRGIEKYRGELEKSDEAARKLKDTGKELGLTFASAAEDALVKWEGFGNLLEGLAADIQRIFYRKAITEPLTNFLGNAFSAGFSGLFSGGGGGGGFSNPAALFGNAAGGLYRVGGAGSEHPVAFTAKAGEYVAVGTKMEAGGGGAPIINIYNQTPADVNARRGADGRSIEVFVTSALERNVSRGGSRLGLKPPIATR